MSQVVKDEPKDVIKEEAKIVIKDERKDVIKEEAKIEIKDEQRRYRNNSSNGDKSRSRSRSRSNGYNSRRYRNNSSNGDKSRSRSRGRSNGYNSRVNRCISRANRCNSRANGEYLVQKIVGMAKVPQSIRSSKKTKYYCIKWIGYTIAESTWEPEFNCVGRCDRLIAEFKHKIDSDMWCYCAGIQRVPCSCPGKCFSGMQYVPFPRELLPK